MCDSCVITVYRQYFGYSISRSTNRNSPGPQICFDRRKVLKGVLTGTQERGRRWATAPSRKWDKYVIFLLFCPQRCSFAPLQSYKMCSVRHPWVFLIFLELPGSNWGVRNWNLENLVCNNSSKIDTNNTYIPNDPTNDLSSIFTVTCSNPPPI